MEIGKISTLLRIVAPVVVKPETASKKASVKEGKYPEKYSGIEPSKLEKIQQQAVIAKLLLILRFSLFFRNAIKKIRETSQVINIGIVKTFTQ